MEDLSGLPTRRQSLRATDLDGNRVVLTFTVSRKLYRCPACRGYIEVGAEHVLVRFLPSDDEGFHQHWHRDCVGRDLLRELRGIEVISAGAPAVPRGRRRRTRS